MAIAKTKQAPEEKPEESEGEKSEETIKKSELLEAVKEIVKDLLPGKSEGSVEEESDSETPAKRLSARDEEEHTRGIVAQAIKEFKDALPKDDGEKKKEAEPEKVPGATSVRKVQGFLWGKE